jgi:hypothetical protein
MLSHSDNFGVIYYMNRVITYIPLGIFFRRNNLKSWLVAIEFTPILLINISVFLE